MLGIAGPSLAGWWGFFESDRGDPSTEADMPTIAPSFVGESMLPFRCPSCKEVPQALACPRTREHYRDKRPGRGNFWCPLCDARFKLDEAAGVPLPSDLKAGAFVGPSRVTRPSGVTWQDRPGLLDGAASVLGLLLPRVRLHSDGYRLLAR